MTVTTMEILGGGGERFPTLSLARATRDALASYTKLRWPTGRRKGIERHWDLTPDQARSVMEGTPSASTIDHIWKHPNGGWAVLLPVMGAVIGHPLHEHLRAEMRVVARQHEELERHARLAEEAHRRLSTPAAARPDQGREVAAPAGDAGGGSGEVGGSRTRRLA